MDFNTALKDKINLVENSMKSYLATTYPDIIYNAMNYSVDAGGKRIRPVFLLAFCEYFGVDINKAMPFACAIEMIHTYSLIHDDLPAMDNDDYRRGKLTNHKVFGEAIAILAGDGLLNMAYEIMARYCEDNFDIKNVRAMNVIANSAGVCGMIGGQTADIEFENKNADIGALLYIHRNKTGKLIQASMVAGAIIGGADKDMLDKISLIGEKLGFAFQIKDDILDVSGDFDKLGKITQADEKKNKTTYVSIFGLEKSKKDYADLCDEINGLITSLGGNNGFLLQLANLLVNREN